MDKLPHYSAPIVCKQTVGPRAKWFVLTIGIVATIFAALAFSARVRFGSFSAGLAYLAGERIVMDATVKHFGQLAHGERRELDFRLTNATSEPIRLVGAVTKCTCVLAQELPLEIAPSTHYDLRIAVLPGREIGPVSQNVHIYTDCASKPQLTLRVVGEFTSG